MQYKEKYKAGNSPQISVIIPTFNESKNILNFLTSVGRNLTKNISSEIIVVDDNSPDGTGKIVQDYIKNNGKSPLQKIDIINRIGKKGLSSAILDGIKQAKGNMIVVLDSDFSHPPQIIQKMIDTLKNPQCDLVIASRYVKGGVVYDWPLKRKLMSKIGTQLVKRVLGIKNSDPLSGFFAFKRRIIEGINFDAIGYKMLLEILVKKFLTLPKIAN